MITVRDAVAADIPDLTAIKGAGSEAQEAGTRYLVIRAEQEAIGFASLVYRRNHPML